jgi:hypothetical protein
MAAERERTAEERRHLERVRELGAVMTLVVAGWRAQTGEADHEAVAGAVADVAAKILADTLVDLELSPEGREGWLGEWWRLTRGLVGLHLGEKR